MNNYSKLPSNNLKITRKLQTNWSIDKLLKEFEEIGIETALRIQRTKPNEITITLNTRNTPKDIQNITRTLFTLYGIAK